MSGPKNAILDKPAADKPRAMPAPRLDLPDGEWAEFQTRPNRREYKAVFKAIADAMDLPSGDRLDMQEQVVALLLVKMSVKDRDGIEIGTSVEALETMPAEKLTLLFERASEIFKAIPSPNLS